MNHAEVLGLALDFQVASGEADEPGTSSTRIHVPAGISLPRSTTSWGCRRLVPKIATLDHTYGSRSVNAAIRRDEILRQDEVEDDLIDYIDGQIDEINEVYKI